MTIQIVRYGSCDLLIERKVLLFVAQARRTITKETVGETTFSFDFDSAVAKAKVQADRAKYGALAINAHANRREADPPH